MLQYGTNQRYASQPHSAFHNIEQVSVIPHNRTTCILSCNIEQINVMPQNHTLHLVLQH